MAQGLGLKNFRPIDGHTLAAQPGIFPYASGLTPYASILP